MLWIQSRVDLHKIYLRSYLKTIQQQQAQPTFHHPSKGLDSSKLEHTWFNNLPLYDEDKSLVLVFDLIESKAVPAKIAYIQSNASYSNRLDLHTLKAYFLINNRLFTRNSRLFLSAAAETVLYKRFKQFQRKIHKNQLILPLFVFTNRL